MTERERSLLGALLRRHRAAVGLTQEQLAERAGISARTVSDVERELRATIYRGTAERLADALGLSETERDEFESAARDRPHGEPPGSAAELVVGTIPPQPTRLVGREHELEALAELLRDRDVRLVTLTGAGGIGKTRLAAEAALRAQSEFAGGVFFVGLGATREPELVASIVAAALGAGGNPSAPAAGIADRLRGRDALLVLDTFEHLLDAAPWVGELLAACPALTVLVTSREPLRLRAEREQPVAPLESPEVGTLPGELARSPASELFVERARAVRPGLVLDPGGARAVAEICRRLDGLPLGIELAAARVRHLPLRDLDEQLEHRLDVLSGGPRDLPERQRTMRAAVAWSDDLLSPAERALFYGLSVFAEGWTLDSATAVCADDVPGAELVATLGGLVDKSLVRLLDGPGSVSRYSMLDVIREYAGERAAEDAERHAATRRRHAEHLLGLARSVPERGEAAAAAELGPEAGNFRAALRWSVDRGDAERAVGLAAALWRFWRARGEYAEGRTWLAEALALEGPAPARPKALWGAAWLAYHQGDHDEAARLGDELAGVGGDDPLDERNALTVRGMVAMARGEFAMALEPFERSVEICRRAGAEWHLATSLLNLGVATMHARDVGSAMELIGKARDIYRDVGDEVFVARTTGNLGLGALLRGDLEEAEELLASSLRGFDAVGDTAGIAEAIDGIAALAAAAGDPLRAARLAAAAFQTRDRLGIRPLPFDVALIEPRLEAARAGADPDAWHAEWERGRALPVSAAVQEALRRVPD